MERNEYLNLCRSCSVLPEGLHGIKLNVPDDCIVCFYDTKYYPQEYILGFDKVGNPTHTAILHDLKANSVIRCPLSKVEKYTNGGVDNEKRRNT